jgi:tetratricopeptide (TPR) repeat protein
MPKSRASAGRPDRATANSQTLTPAAGRAAPRTAARRPRAAAAHPVTSGPLSLFEHGVAAMQRHDFETAARHFREMRTTPGLDAEVRERARVYLLACDRQLANPTVPRSTEERLYAATLAYNRGALDEAERLLVETTSAEPKHDFAAFLLAVVRTARGAFPEALKALDRAVALNAENRLRALREPDLAPLRQTDGFRKSFGKASR